MRGANINAAAFIHEFAYIFAFDAAGIRWSNAGSAVIMTNYSNVSYVRKNTIAYANSFVVTFEPATIEDTQIFSSFNRIANLCIAAVALTWFRAKTFHAESVTFHALVGGKVVVISGRTFAGSRSHINSPSYGGAGIALGRKGAITLKTERMASDTL